jgi:phosphoglycerate kinase
MAILKMTDVDLRNKRVLIREDFNVPIENGKVTNARRIEAAIPTIQLALKANAKVLLMSHLGRPIEGQFDSAFSLAPVAEILSDLLQLPVTLKKDWLDGVEVAHDQVVLYENVRFNRGEKKNDAALAKKMAALCDVFVMDAFGTAHRAEASTYGVAEFAKVACAGPLLMAELDALSKAFLNPKPPLLAIIGGSKVSTKLTVLESLLKKVNRLIVGGGIANTFLAAQGHNIGKSLVEMDLIPVAKRLLQIAQQQDIQIPLPVDVVVANEFSKEAKATIKKVNAITSDEMILDIGPETAIMFAEIIKTSGTVIWNGPVGVFEFPSFAAGTKALANAMATTKAYTLAGGGDTLAAIDMFGIAEKLSYISTGGGAFLEFIEGKELPAVKILQLRS